MDNAPNLAAAAAFLKLLDQNDRYTFQTFEDKKPPMQRDLAKIVHSPEAADRLKTLHRLGAGIYVTVNETDMKGRTVENIRRVRGVFQEDDEGFYGEFPLEPSCVVQSSPGHFHRYWLIDGDWPADEQGRADFANVMGRMIELYGSDKNAKDIARVLRVPGFLHRKNGGAHLITMISNSGRRYTREQILQAFPPVVLEQKPKTQQREWRPDGDEDRRIADALRSIDANDRDVWLQIGMALKDELGDGGRGLWDNWSMASSKYDAKDQDHKWKSFKRQGITIGTLFYHAKQSGWSSERKYNGKYDGAREDEPEAEPQTSNEQDKDAALLRAFAFVNDAPAAPQAMLIDDVLPLAGLPFIGGQSSAGKTFIAIMMAACAATQKPFFGREVRERVGSVIVAAEGRTMLRSRILAALQKLGVDEKDVPIAWLKETPDFSNAQSLAAFIGKLKALSAHFQQKFGMRLGLVFVDTVSASFDIQEEADNSEASRVCKVMQRIAEMTGAIVVPIHHYGKNAAVGLRGASAWRASADIVLSVTADIDAITGHVTNRQLSMGKDRDGAQGPITGFTLEPVTLGVDETGNPFGSMVAVPIDMPASASVWPIHLSTFKQALMDTLISSGVDEQPFAKCPVVKTVDVEAVKNVFATLTHTDSETEEGRKEAIRKQFKRRLDQAQELKLIGLHADAAGHTKIWLIRSPDAKPIP